MKKLTRLIPLVFVLLTLSAHTQVISQWRGPDRNGIYPETNLLVSWPDEGPELLWSASGIGKGFSSVAVTDDALFLTGIQDSTDYLVKLTKKGEILWEVPFGRSWQGSFPETRTTPTIEDERIYVVSGGGGIACIDAGNGSINWSFDAAEKFDAAWGLWGICESLLLVDNKVIYTPAGIQTTMVALDKETGETIWASESISDTTGYVSPLLINRGERKIIVTVLANHIIGVDANDGTLLWKHHYFTTDSEKSQELWPNAPNINTNTPLYHNGRLYITSGYNHVGAMFDISEDGEEIELIWTDHTLDTHHGGVVLVDGFVYGSNWTSNRSGNWCCVNWETGEPAWEETWYNKGSVISAGGMLYIYDEKKGNVGLVKASPDKFDLISSFEIAEGNGPHWSHPVIHDGILYIRHGEVLMAFDIRKN